MAKDRKIRVPKEIAGVKVPKKVRKAGNKALELADHPAALELAAAALSAAAVALQKKGRSRSSAAAGPALAGPAQDAGDHAAKLGDLVKLAALEGARRLLDNVAAPAAAGGGEAKPAKPKRNKAKPDRGKSAKAGRRKPSGGPAGSAAPGESPRR